MQNGVLNKTCRPVKEETLPAETLAFFGQKEKGIQPLPCQRI